jgi:hypothetical protein
MCHYKIKSMFYSENSPQKPGFNHEKVCAGFVTTMTSGQTFLQKTSASPSNRISLNCFSLLFVLYTSTVNTKSQTETYLVILYFAGIRNMYSRTTGYTTEWLILEEALSERLCFLENQFKFTDCNIQLRQ